MQHKGSTIKPSTSQPCTWNRGKKREKNPQQLHVVEYSSSKCKPPSALYMWNPRDLTPAAVLAGNGTS